MNFLNNYIFGDSLDLFNGLTSVDGFLSMIQNFGANLPLIVAVIAGSYIWSLIKGEKK
ncbi:hypothetical protein J4N45_14420 [Vibrio sp. SCSIO 43140]|uniref:hypothetical protein n=1 Tax=Vibrio sp. SCSIO 43140 TaxID=2819100 RepID=UPI0020752686|nr:hypothetical protein [Vibrio sp. SCSIO 43140]USD58816.1 hypothetical protein J4N45_09765 [Vibrio sp. SCSIO 43140]USD59150.1 hypothetical protein J4N45_11470 [Vibrio sp. SCSIO 43140]USD59697.1 hypothetical protein J4N45_14420 [Vibrio sp. SCSIO 43140]